MNKFTFTLDNKRYHTLNYYNQCHYGSKVFKISINGGFSCPNLDGVISRGGCIYCSKSGSGEFAGNPLETIEEQFDKQKAMMVKKWPTGKYIVYFGTRTNTYADVATLKTKFEPLLKKDNVIGLSIATRPDAITDDIYDYLEDLSKRTNLTIELGLQSSNEITNKLINRHHSNECFTKAVYKLHDLNINVVVHIINGLPYETKQDMINTIEYLAKLPITGVKIHSLFIIKDTPIANLYQKSPWPLLTKEEYVEIVATQLTKLPAEVVIHRVTGDPKKEDLIAPLWSLKKFIVMNDIDKYMVLHDLYQGCKS